MSLKSETLFQNSWLSIEGCFRALPLGISLKVFANLSFSALKKFLRLNRNEMSIKILIVYLVVVACHVL